MTWMQFSRVSQPHRALVVTLRRAPREIVGFNRRNCRINRLLGRLAAWQEPIATAYIEEHFAELNIAQHIGILAGLERLIPYLPDFHASIDMRHHPSDRTHQDPVGEAFILGDGYHVASQGSNRGNIEQIWAVQRNTF